MTLHSLNKLGKVSRFVLRCRDVLKPAVDVKGGGDSSEPRAKRAKMVNETVTVKNVSNKDLFFPEELFYQSAIGQFHIAIK